MQTLSLGSTGRNGQLLLDSKTSMRLRAFRFVSNRYTQRERPSVVAEFVLFAVIAATGVIWPMVALAHAIRLIR
jgi:hypothetical protein